MNLTLLQGFNNYYNRVVKKFDTLSDYLQWTTDNGKLYATLPQINFNPNDGVDTTQVINWSYSWNPDYVVIDDGFGNITRWFIVESNRLRGSQFQLQLRRDLLVDYYDTILDAPCFIEKATLKPSDPFIYNNEGMTFNQIKQPEIQLRDRSNCAWIVGYYDYNYIPSKDGDPSVGTEGSSPVAGQLYAEYVDELAYQVAVQSSFQNWKFYPYISGLANILYGTDYIQTWSLPASYGGPWYEAYLSAKDYTTNIVSSDNSSTVEKFIGRILHLNSSEISVSGYNTRSKNIDENIIKSAYDNYGWDNLNNILKNFFPYITKNEYEELLSYNNKVVKFTDSNGNVEFYKITLQDILDTTNSTFTSGNYAYKSFKASGRLNTALNNIQKNAGYYYNNINNNDKYYVRVQYQSTKINAQKLTYGTYSTKFPSASYKLTDAPYGMFCIPCPNPGENVIIKNTGGSNANGITIDRDISLRMAQELGNKYAGAGVIYDLQILPYCAVQQIFTINGLDLNNNPKLFTPINRTEKGITTVSGYILFASFSSFTLDIPLTNSITIKDRKIESQTDMYRLVSPNYNGQFEFNAAKNGGIERINVDCTYKPYNPYIHLNPDFGELYGSDYNDARGLICGGDFSLTLINNAWETYQIQNKNYQNIFDRDIQNMEINQKIQRQREVFAGITGVAGGGIAGGISGAKSGPIGAIAGAIGGAATAAIGAGLNYNWNETLRNEAIDYKRDQFGYNLGNIQALPQSITKTTAFTYNNKVFPILEYYTCKNEEKIALANKVAYNGMTVMRIGTIGEFINNDWSYTINGETIKSKNYIKGQIIRLEDVNCDDFHVANEIANEVFKGAFYETKN